MTSGWRLPNGHGKLPPLMMKPIMPVSLSPSLPMNLHFVGCACAPISSTLAITLRPLPSPPPSGEGAVWLSALTPKWCASAPYGKVHRAQFGRRICDRGLSPAGSASAAESRIIGDLTKDERKLAAVIFGESSTMNIFEEMEGVLLDFVSKKTIQVSKQTSGKLPKVDWEVLGGYAINHSGKRWGTCLEFTHVGLGKSGSFQRWSSVFLIPWQDSKPGFIAYRFVGYWAGCDALSEGTKPGEVSLPTLEPLKEGGMQILWHSCTPQGCTTAKDNRKISEDSTSERGTLMIQPMP